MDDHYRARQRNQTVELRLRELEGFMTDQGYIDTESRLEDLETALEAITAQQAALTARLEAIVAALARERHFGDAEGAENCPDAMNGRACQCACYG